MLTSITVFFFATEVRQRLERARGINRSIVENVFLIYRGRWPNKMRPVERERFGGTTWGDQWCQ
eukprot:12903767-Prorocentrum_lima.AAC.1